MDLSSDSSRPLLSIVVAVYNGEKFLPQFFDCLLKQTLPAWELILVNDGSKDNTDAVLREWQDKFPSVTILEQAIRAFLWRGIPVLPWQKGNTSRFRTLMM